MKSIFGKLALTLPLAAAFQGHAQQQRPNIIFFLVDDFCWVETSLPFGD